MSAQRKIIILCSIFFNLQIAFGQNAEGIIGRLNSRGFEFVREQATNAVNETVFGFRFPSIEGSLSVFSYSLNNLSLETFNLGQLTFEPEAPRFLVLGMNNTDIKMSGLFGGSVSFGFFGPYMVSGNIVAGVSGFGLSHRITLQRNDRGVLTISSAGCTASVGEISIEVNNVSPGWINSALQTGLPSLTSYFGPQLNNVICETLQQAIDGSSSSIFESIDGNFDIPTASNWNISVDLSLSRPPAITNNAVELAAIGRCFPNNFPTLTESFPIPIHPSLSPSSRMVQLSLNDYVINTFLASIEYRGLLEASVSSGVIARIISLSTGVIFNTEFLTLLNPEINKLPVDNNTPFFVVLRPLSTPRVNLQEESFGIVGAYEIDVEFILQNGSFIEQDLLLELDFNIAGKLGASEDALFWQFTEVDFRFRNTTNPIVQLFQTFSSNIVVTSLNAFTNSDVNEIELPSFAGFALNIESLVLKQNAIELITDVVVVEDDDDDDVDDNEDNESDDE